MADIPIWNTLANAATGGFNSMVSGTEAMAAAAKDFSHLTGGDQIVPPTQDAASEQTSPEIVMNAKSTKDFNTDTPSDQFSQQTTYTPMSEQAKSVMSERADYYAPSDLGDTETQRLMKEEGYNINQALAIQQQGAIDSKQGRAAAYYKNEAAKAYGSDVALSSEFHHEAQDSGLPVAYNPFEYRGDLARRFLESSQGTDNSAENALGTKQPRYDSMMKEANIIAKAERTNEMGGYDKIGGSWSSNFNGRSGNLSIGDQQDIAAKAGKWTTWNVDRTESGEADTYRTDGYFNPNFMRSQGYDLKYREADIKDTSKLSDESRYKAARAEWGVKNDTPFFPEFEGMTPEERATAWAAKYGGGSSKESPTDIAIKTIRVGGSNFGIAPTGVVKTEPKTTTPVNNDVLKSALVGGGMIIASTNPIGASLVASNLAGKFVKLPEVSVGKSTSNDRMSKDVDRTTNIAGEIALASNPLTMGVAASNIAGKFVKLPEVSVGESRSNDVVKVRDFGTVKSKNADVVKVGDFGESNFRIDRYTTKVSDFKSTPTGYGNDMLTKRLAVVRPTKPVPESNEPIIDVMALERQKSASNIAGVRSGMLDAYGGASNAYNTSQTFGVRTPSGGLSVNMGSGVSAVALPRRAKKSQPQIKREVYIPSTLNVLNNVLINKSTKATVLSPKGSGVGNANFNGLSDSFIKNTVKATGINIGGGGKKSSSNNIANNINDLVGIINKKQKPTNTTKSKRK